MVYYVIAFIAMLLGIFLGVVAGAYTIDKVREAGASRENKKTQYYEKLNKKPKRKKDEETEMMPVILPTSEAIVDDMQSYEEEKSISMEEHIDLDKPVTESLIAKRVAPRESYTEAKASMDNANVNDVVKSNRKNNTTQYEILRRRKRAERENTGQEQPDMTSSEE